MRWINDLQNGRLIIIKMRSICKTTTRLRSVISRSYERIGWGKIVIYLAELHSSEMLGLRSRDGGTFWHSQFSEMRKYPSHSSNVFQRVRKRDTHWVMTLDLVGPDWSCYLNSHHILVFFNHCPRQIKWDSFEVIFLRCVWLWEKLKRCSPPLWGTNLS